MDINGCKHKGWSFLHPWVKYIDCRIEIRLEHVEFCCDCGIIRIPEKAINSWKENSGVSVEDDYTGGE